MEFCELPLSARVKKELSALAAKSITETLPEVIFNKSIDEKMSRPLKKSAINQNDLPYTRNKKKLFDRKICLDLTEEKPDIIFERSVVEKVPNPLKRVAEDQSGGPSAKLCFDLTEDQPCVISDKSLEKRMKENDKKKDPVKGVADDLCDRPSSKVKKESNIKNLGFDLTEEQPRVISDKSLEKRRKENDKKKDPVKRVADDLCDRPPSKVKKESNIKNEKNADLKLAAITELKDSAIEKKVFPKITAEMEKVITRALGPGDPCEQFSTIDCFDLTRRDIHTLCADGWLNDQVINFYLAMIAERSKLDNYPSVYTFNSYFYPSVSNRGNSVVSRWTKEADIFSYDLLFVPVHLGLHWALITVDHRSKSLLYYDSLDCRGKAYLKHVKDYLVAEMMDKKSQVLNPDAYSMKIAQDIPKQENGSDCGVFILKYAEYISRDAPITFSDIHMAYFRRRLVYELITKQIL